MIKVDVKINGKKITLTGYPMERLIDSIRNAGLTGTKEGCGEGECGACSILMNNKLVNSCLIPLAQVSGAEITTVEGLAQNNELNPLQQSFLKCGGAQCGICTPGMLIASTYLLNKSNDPSLEDIKDGLAGNFCRCTGHTKIIESIQNLNKKDCHNEGLCSKL